MDIADIDILRDHIKQQQSEIEQLRKDLSALTEQVSVIKKFSDMRNKYNVRDIHLIFAGFMELWIRLNGLENKVFPNLCTDLDAIAEIIGRSGDPTLGDKFDTRPADNNT